MAKRKSKAKHGSNTLANIAWFLAFIATILTSFVIGYYVGKSNMIEDMLKKERLKEQKKLTLLQQLEQRDREKEKDSVSARLKEVLEKESKKESHIESKKAVKSVGASHEYDDADVVVLPEPPKREIKKSVDKPKLAIIIDDVSSSSHVNAIKSLNLPLTMSFLPPSKLGPNSNILAAKEKFYMVHLPMEAKNFTKEEPFTLRVDDTQKDISDRIHEIQQLFPRVQYINNHTGSKFTSNELAVNKLIYVLEKQNINFIDSRTIASTKVPQVMQNYGKKYMARDVFLDHENDKKYIISQIKIAIETAKLHGTAIAIGHPHANTILAINESKKLFSDVELVLVDKLY